MRKPAWQVKQTVCLALAAAAAALANQSLILTGGLTATYSTPNRSPYIGLTSMYVDMRIHGWSLPGSCQNLAQVSGTVNNPFVVRMCPSGQQPGMLTVTQFTDNLNGIGLGVNPPNVLISAVTFANPAVLTLSASLPATVTVGSKIHVINPNGTGTGCNALIGDWTISAMSGTQVTINANTTACSAYTGGSAAAAVDDFLFRWHRDQVLQQYIFEVWNVDGTLYASQMGPVATFGATNQPQNGLQFGDQFLTARFGYVRWYGGTAAAGAKPPWGSSCNTGSACLGDWEFEGNGNDNSGNNLNLTYSAPANYTGTPVYPPACSAGPQQSFRAGVPGTLDGTLSFPLDGGTTLSYVWQQFPSSEPGVSTQNLVWSSHTAAQPLITGVTFGPINLNLTVTESNGQSTMCSVHDGATATDSSGSVVIGNSGLNALMGPIQRLGLNGARWPWLDIITKQWADKLGGFQGQIVPGGLVTVFEPTWNNAVAGCTVSATNFNGTLTFSGCNAQAQFCAGGTTPSPGDIYAVLFYTYPIAGGGGGTGRRFYQVSGCPTASTVTINGVWTPATQAGMQFSIIFDPDFGSWVGGGFNINYYDDVLAFYGMYFRTGIDSYLHYARYLADNWWQSPWTDRGNCKDGLTGWCSFPRIAAVTGLFARALDQDAVAGSPGSSVMWPGIRVYIDTAFRSTMNTRVNASVMLADLRENSYNDMFVALDALLDPDATRRTALLGELSNSLAYWTSLRQADGHWQSFTGTWTNINIGNAFNEMLGCTVNVTNGSPTVTLSGSGCAWTSSMFTDICAGNPCAEFLAFGNPFVTSQRDSQFYVAMFTNSTTITLTQNYQGATQTGKNWVLSSDATVGSDHAWIGFGTQPFMEGINGWMFVYMYNAFAANPAFAAQAATAKGYAIDAANWVSKSTTDGTGGTDPATRGALYGVGFGQCTPGNDTNGCRCGPNNQNCGSPIASRENMGEALGELAQAYVYSPTPGLLAAIENVYSACYAKFPYDPGYDGTYCQDYDPLNNGFFWQTNNGKWLGFMLGIGRNAGWPSGRLGGLSAAINRPVNVAFNLASVPGATKVVVTLTQPAGTTRQSTCTASPCVIQTDASQGNPTVTISYLSASGAVLSTSTQSIPVTVQ